MPSGILWGKECVLGAGLVVDPGVFVEELDDLEARGISTETVRLSGNAHLVMPWHVALDGASERRLGKLQIGDDPSGNRAGLRGQVDPARDPRPGPLRREDPPPEDRGRTC